MMIVILNVMSCEGLALLIVLIWFTFLSDVIGLCFGIALIDLIRSMCNGVVYIEMLWSSYTCLMLIIWCRSFLAIPMLTWLSIVCLVLNGITLRLMWFFDPHSPSLLGTHRFEVYATFSHWMLISLKDTMFISFHFEW